MRAIGRLLGLALMMGSLAVAAGLAQDAPSPADLYQQALYLQEVKGDLRTAIDLYRTIADRYADDPVAPKALLELAACYEKLGKPESTKVYELLATKYTSSGAPAATARAKLADNGPTSPAISVQKVLDGRSYDAVSPDGKYLTVSSDDDTGDLAVYELSSGRYRKLTKNPKKYSSIAENSRPSPDGRWIAYGWLNGSSNREELRVISHEGGEPRVILVDDTKERAAFRFFEPFGWSADGRTIFTEIRESRRATGTNAGAWSVALATVPANGGTTNVIARFNGEPQQGAPGDRPGAFNLSPDGRYIAYSRPQSPTSAERDVFVLSVADGTSRVVVSHAADDHVLAWLPNSSTVLFESDRSGAYGIWAVELSDGRAAGEPRLVQPNIGHVDSLGFARDGAFYYGTSRSVASVQIARLDAAGKLVGRPATIQGRYAEGMRDAVWSPDGRRLAYVQMTRFGPVQPRVPAKERTSDWKLAIQTIGTGDVRLLTLTLPTSYIGKPSWLPDGSALVLEGAYRDESQGVFLANATNGELTPVAVRGDRTQRYRPVPSLDGHRLYYLFQPAPPIRPVGTRAILVRDLDSGGERVLVSTGESSPLSLAMSPDGRWLAWTIADRASTGTYVMSTAGGEVRRVLSSAETNIAWSQDSRSVFVESKDHQIVEVPVDGGEPRDTGIHVAGALNRISVHPDGRQLALSVETTLRETWAMSDLARAARTKAAK